MCQQDHDIPTHGNVLPTPDPDRFRPGEDVSTWLRRLAKVHIDPGVCTLQVSSLSQAQVLLQTKAINDDDAVLTAWKCSIKQLMQFRGELRKATGNRFLHADLGLPILLGQGDNPPRLEGIVAQAQRLASAVVLKPLALPSGGAHRMATVLSAPHVWDSDAPGVQLTGPSGRTLNVQDLKNTSDVGASLMTKCEASARDAFVRYLQSRWAEVSLMTLNEVDDA